MSTPANNISIIAAVADDGAIGSRGGLLCHISADLRHFKAVTGGHTVIMGRRTFDSLPKGALPNRRNIVVTRNPSFQAPGTEAASSLEEALAMAGSDREVFIIGGGQIYAEALPLASRLCLTLIHGSFPDADTHFPVIRQEEWTETEREDFPADDHVPYPFSFVTLERKPNK